MFFSVLFSAYMDGYMMPAPSVASATSNTYAAPNKLGFLASLKSKGFRRQMTNEGSEGNKRSSKPVHYKRSSEESNVAYSADSVQFQNGDAAYDSIGAIMSKIPQNRRPTLPENHPGRMMDLQHTSTKLQVHKRNERDQNARPQPSAPPQPKRRQTTNGSSSTGADVVGYDQAGNVARQQYNVLPPSRPVPRRPNNPPNQHNQPKAPQTSTNNGVAKQPMNPPMRPVPRTQGNQGFKNAAFQPGDKEVNI